MNSNKTNPNNASKNTSKKVTSRQIVALAGVVLLVLLYIITLFAAIFDSSAGHHLFAICLFSTVAVPILIWLYSWIYTKLTGGQSIASVPETHIQDANEDL